MHWRTTTALICVYGIVKEFRPATPFLTPFLVADKNLTLEEVYSLVYPFWTYSYMMFLMPVFFLTDVLRYKPVIVLEAASLVATWALLCWGQGLLQMQLMQIAFGLASAAEIAYFSYMYAVVEQKRFKMITSYIRSAALVGKLFAFASAQILVWTGTGSYLLLNQLSFGAVAFVFFVALLLPTVPSKKSSSIFDGETEQLTRADVELHKMDKGLKKYFHSTVHSLRIYKDRHVLKWSLWWALASCGMYQVYNYMQPLWMEMQENPENVANGITEFANTLSGAILSFGVQYLAIDWHRYGELTLIIASLAMALVLFGLVYVTNVVYGYIGYVLVTSIYHTLITAASANIASSLTVSNYGLVFGVNTFVAVVLQTILTLSVADASGLNLPIRQQFIVYAGYFVFVGLVFIAFFVCERVRKRTSENAGTSTAEVGNEF